MSKRKRRRAAWKGRKAKREFLASAWTCPLCGERHSSKDWACLCGFVDPRRKPTPMGLFR